MVSIRPVARRVRDAARPLAQTRVFAPMFDAGGCMAVGAAKVDPGLAADAWKMRRLSRDAFRGWATTNPTRFWEYPWVIRQVKLALGRRPAKVADFGAGQSPVPLAMAALGYQTFVVDPDSAGTGSQVLSTGCKVGSPSPTAWQWVDYARWGVTTHQSGMEDRVFTEGELAAAVCVSVIEHLPARVRRAGLAEIARALGPTGRAVITVDTFPDGQRLWNRAYGLAGEVEPTEAHGTIDDLVRDARTAGLDLYRTEYCPLRTRRIKAVGHVFTKTQAGLGFQ